MPIITSSSCRAYASHPAGRSARITTAPSKACSIPPACCCPPIRQTDRPHDPLCRRTEAAGRSVWQTEAYKIPDLSREIRSAGAGQPEMAREAQRRRLRLKRKATARWNCTTRPPPRRRLLDKAGATFAFYSDGTAPPAICESAEACAGRGLERRRRARAHPFRRRNLRRVRPRGIHRAG